MRTCHHFILSIFEFRTWLSKTRYLKTSPQVLISTEGHFHPYLWFDTNNNNNNNIILLFFYYVKTIESLFYEKHILNPLWHYQSIDYLIIFAKCTAGNFVLQKDSEWNLSYMSDQLCGWHHRRWVDYTHIQRGGQMALAVCWRPCPSLSPSRDPSNRKWVRQTGGVPVCVWEDSDIRLSSAHTMYELRWLWSF